MQAKTKPIEVVTTRFVCPAAFMFPQLQHARRQLSLYATRRYVPEHQRIQRPQRRRHIITTQQPRRLFPRDKQQPDRPCNRKQRDDRHDGKPQLDPIRHPRRGPQHGNGDHPGRHLQQNRLKTRIPKAARDDRSKRSKPTRRERGEEVHHRPSPCLGVAYAFADLGPFPGGGTRGAGLVFAEAGEGDGAVGSGAEEACGLWRVGEEVGDEGDGADAEEALGDA